MNKSIGVIGSGIVGNAFYEGMKHAFEIVRYDKFRQDLSDVGSIAELLTAVDGPIFVCVPTPMNKDGSCNISIVGEVVSEITDKRFVVIKSTVPPGTTESLNEIYHNNIVFNPEFLTEANAVEDFRNQDRIIIGGHHAATRAITEIYTVAYPNVLIMECSSGVAEMAKYVTNCFLAAKVSFANEIFQICQAMDIDYNTVINTATLDSRLGKSHWKVPGHDGHFGFGNACFPKDLNALICVAESIGIKPTVMKVAWDKNLEVRPERDWEELKGRAIL